MAEVETKTNTRPKVDIAHPPMFKVIYINDDQTSVEFVIESLIEHFHYDSEAAAKKTIDIHTDGSAVVAVLPYEVAEQKGIEITLDARSQSYPLQIKLEPESV